jgi:hypothetical protein
LKTKPPSGGGGGWTRTNDLGIMRTQVGSELLAEFYTLLFFSAGYKSVGLICSAWKRLVLIVQSLQFHYSANGHELRPPTGFEDHLRCSDAFGKFFTIPDFPTAYQECVLMRLDPF